MSWAIGYDSNWNRDIGYGVPSICDHPDCKKMIDRGLGYVCGNVPYGGEYGCGLFFCWEHQVGDNQNCERCMKDEGPFKPKTDTQRWKEWKRTDESWAQWREENPGLAAKLIDESIEEHGDGIVDTDLRIIYKHFKPYGIRDKGGYLFFFADIGKYDGQVERYQKETEQQVRLADYLLDALQKVSKKL